MPSALTRKIVGLAVAIVIEDAGAASEEACEAARERLAARHRFCFAADARGANRGQRRARQAEVARNIDKVHGNCGRRGAGRRAGNFSRERIFALAAVDKRDRLAEALPGDVAETLEMRLRAGGVSRIVCQLRKAIFRRRLERIDFDRAMKFGAGFIEMAGLGVEKAQEIVGDGVIGIERGNFLEIGERGVGVVGGAFEQREIEPRARALRIALDGCFENAARVVVAAHVEKGDAGVEAADVGPRIEDAGGLEFAEGLGELAAVHQHDADVVGANRLGVGERLRRGAAGFSRAPISVRLSRRAHERASPPGRERRRRMRARRRA